jgi:hypothetical protein
MTIRNSLWALPILLAPALALPACSAQTEDEDERAPVDRCDEEGVICQAYGRQNTANKPPAFELGTGDGSPTSVTFKTILQGPAGHQPVDLEFNPTRSRELWVSNYASSSVTVITNPGSASQRARMVRDPAYLHFMNMPPAFAFGIESYSGYGQQWASCGDNDNGGNYFMGPTLYSSDERLLGKQTQGGLGAHLDMLHSTSYCRGIAWAGAKNQFFTFNADQGSVDWYDFQTNHAPGEDDHSDGRIRRFWNRQVKGVDGLVSHLSYDAETKKLYVADTGNKRILALEPAKGRRVAPMRGANEPLVERDYHEAPLQVLVPPGTLGAPSGIEATGGLAFVTDAETSTIYAFKLSDGTLVRKLATGLPAGSLAGLNFGPEGKIYFVDRKQNRVIRIDP